jgi:hypothetical protein
MMRLLSAALRSCSFFSSSAAFFLNSNCSQQRLLPRPLTHRTTHPKLLLSLRGHETFLGLLRFGGLLHASPDLSAFALDLLLFPLLFLLTKPQSAYLPPVYKIARILLFCILHFFASLFVASLRASSSFFLCKRNDANQKTNYLDAT